MKMNLPDDNDKSENICTEYPNKYRGGTSEATRIIAYDVIWWLFTFKNGHIRRLKIIWDGRTDGSDLV